MNTSTKIWLIVAFALILTGFIVFIGVMATLKWDFTKLSTAKYETNIYEIKEDFSSISINTDTEDITLLPSENGKCELVCFEHKNRKHSATVKDGVLIIEHSDTEKWYNFIRINFKSPKITLYLPQAEYSSLKIKENTGDIDVPEDFKFERAEINTSTGNVKWCASFTEVIKISTSTGDIYLKDIKVGSLELSVSTGDISASHISCDGEIKLATTTGEMQLYDITCNNLTSSGSTGDISLCSVIATEKISITRSTGDVDFKNCDASEIFVKTSTGDVEGSLLSEKVFFVDTDTGTKRLPDTASGGRCEIKTSTGDIIISISTQ